MLYVVSYDITDDTSRTKLSKILEGRGIRVQYSVFECILEPNDLGELLKQLAGYVCTSDGDSVRIYPLTQDTVQKVQIVGDGEVYDPGQLRMF